MRHARFRHLITISGAVALVLAGLALHGSGSTGSATFRDAAYGPQNQHVELTGVVTAPHAHGGARLTIKEGKMTVGAWTISAATCSGSGLNRYCDQHGSGKMTIAELRGRVSIYCFAYRKKVTGTLIQAHQFNQETFNHCPPEKVGNRFSFRLNY